MELARVCGMITPPVSPVMAALSRIVLLSGVMDEVVGKGIAVFRSPLLIAGVSTILGLLLSLSLLDLQESFLCLHSTVSIVVLGHEGVPPLLLFSCHGTTVSSLSELINLTEDRGSFFFQLFEFTHNIIGF